MNCPVCNTILVNNRCSECRSFLKRKREREMKQQSGDELRRTVLEIFGLPQKYDSLVPEVNSLSLSGQTGVQIRA